MSNYVDVLLPIPIKQTFTYAINENEAIQLNHFTNLQPLCSKVNRDVKRDLWG